MLRLCNYSDSGNARSLVAKDILEEKGIEFYEAPANEHISAPNGTDMHINGCLFLLATFKDQQIYLDCLVTDDLSEEIIVSWHEAERIGAIKIAEDDWPARLSVSNAARICAIRGGNPQLSS